MGLIMWEVAEFIEPYGMWIEKEFKTEKEAKEYCDKRNAEGERPFCKCFKC